MTKSVTRSCRRNGYFNSHPHEEDDFPILKNRSGGKYFNSHPHEEDDALNSSKSFGNSISTHILTKRMTSQGRFRWLRKSISTHILTKRMTMQMEHCFCSDLYFNSHPHEEDDRNSALFQSQMTYFNSHPHEEDDRTACGWSDCRYISTHILTKRMTYPNFSRHYCPVFQLTSSRRG